MSMDLGTPVGRFAGSGQIPGFQPDLSQTLGRGRETDSDKTGVDALSLLLRPPY